MNIFYTHHSPYISAINLPDKLVVKMVLESAQMLSSAHRLTDGSKLSVEQDKELYRITHENHPSNLWARSSLQAYSWLYHHFISLCDEYTHRYGKTHACDKKFRIIFREPPRLIERSLVFVEPPLCMPEKYFSNSVALSYRKYMVAEKSYFAKWEKDPSRKPDWWVTKNEESV